ncbi:hypothetical protein CBR_g10842 [Chara braunii]|uniref:ESCRT-II complex subunit VPS25 n=1 Tax=Chara braunii TaxID=69332 RepID=A0A388KPD2_CHABU|nr:hypothetical protein CBR_g10842 [Chara braunii]|eukprot:GBG71906.1 hypothetical protein CBR_g10842 [Chara braunii]
MRTTDGEAFSLPYFFHYPPYFTLQPVRDTREKQIQLWKDLILNYCKHYKVFAIDVEGDFPLFSNSEIERRLNTEAKRVFLSALVSEGRAEWLDKAQRRCLIFWRRVEDWAGYIYSWADSNALVGGVATMEELRSGDDVKGTDLEGIDINILRKAMKVLEQRGKAVLFRGTSADDEGIKFLN